jgi:hypothetical protein
MDDKVVISTEVLNRVLAYLAERPFREVYGLIGAIQQSAQENQVNSKEDSESDSN